MIPTDEKFITELAFRMCVQAGDSWVSDDGAQDQWKSTAYEFAVEANKVERWQKKNLAFRRKNIRPPNTPDQVIP